MTTCDEENREYALMRCMEIWSSRYPLESFENEASWDSQDSDTVAVVGGSLKERVFKEVEKQRVLLCSIQDSGVCNSIQLVLL